MFPLIYKISVMKKITLLSSIVFTTLCCFSQNNIIKDSSKLKIDTNKIVKDESWDKTFTSVEIEPQFPGGTEAFNKYLQKNLKPSTPANNGAPEGTYNVQVTFIVDTNGDISNVYGKINNNGNDYGTIAEVVKVIKKGPKWIPGMQNGHKVKSYKVQKFTFTVKED